MSAARDAVMRRARVDNSDRWTDKELYNPRYNAQPGYWTPVVTSDTQGQRSLHTMKWGLVPCFTKKDQRPDHFRMVRIVLCMPFECLPTSKLCPFSLIREDCNWAASHIAESSANILGANVYSSTREVKQCTRSTASVACLSHVAAL